MYHIFKRMTRGSRQLFLLPLRKPQQQVSHRKEQDHKEYHKEDPDPADLPVSYQIEVNGEDCEQCKMDEPSESCHFEVVFEAAEEFLRHVTAIVAH